MYNTIELTGKAHAPGALKPLGAALKPLGAAAAS